ncbi:ABC transporter substrate-binding protein [Gordonia sp. HY002]|uniref:glycine betaine ABC transporter substrate-binding protein n=1 Tax=Gordonia zhenghanii TaxID=2911516 RepID=UPI001EF05DAC|nr:glycine betaine ABC transporter substrate-binding protein [Gordonia zhenghanii]MCF8570603.1 ABC transporter substrate-binding protein [Gordonia zhenghanii]MCF8605070.1 ABC transporter substrate-binding protein [Gordonia zhenghanii]
MGIQQRGTVERITAIVGAVVVAVSLAACGGDDDPVLTVGHDGSVESRTAAAVYAGALARTGLQVETVADSASQAELLDQVASGGLGLYPAFTGDLLVQLTPAPKAVTAPDVLADVNRSLPQQVSIGDPALVSDRWQILAQQTAIEASGAETLADCGRLQGEEKPLLVTRTPPPSVLGAVAVCEHGPVQTVATAEEAASRVRSGDALGLTTALDSASVDDLTGVQTLKSDGAPIAQQLVPVFASGPMAKPQLKALSRVAGELTTADLAQMMRKVRDGSDPRAVARQWLSTNGV